MPFKSDRQRRAAYAKKPSKAAPRRTPLGAIVNHRGNQLILDEDSKTWRNRIYDLKDPAGTRLGILGSELDSLLEGWRKDNKRRTPLPAGTQLLRDVNGEHTLILTSDSGLASSRVYAVRNSRGHTITLRGLDLGGLSEGWAVERGRKGREPAEPEAPRAVKDSDKARSMGREDAVNQVRYVMGHGGTVEDGIKAHRAYRRSGDLFTDQHGDNDAFHRGAEAEYRRMKRRAA